MESMEPISALYTTDYPEIHPEESCRSAGSPLGSPSAPSYNEDLMHKVGSVLVLAWPALYLLIRRRLSSCFICLTC